MIAATEFTNMVSNCTSQNELLTTVNGAMRVFGEMEIPAGEGRASTYNVWADLALSPAARHVLACAERKAATLAA